MIKPINGMALVRMDDRWTVKEKTTQTDSGILIVQKGSDIAIDNPYEEGTLISIHEKDNHYAIKEGSIVGIDVGSAKGTSEENIYMVPNINIRYIIDES